MTNQIGGFEDIVEKGQTAVKNVAKSSQRGVANFAKTAARQTTKPQQSDQRTDEANASGASSQQKSDADAKKFLQDLYGAKNTNQGKQSSQNNNLPVFQKSQSMANQKNVKTALGLTGSGVSQKRTPTPAETIKTALGIPGEVASQKNAPTPTETIKIALGIPEAKVSEKTPEELAKIEALRKQLHGEYYQTVTNPKREPEETVADKLERESEEEKMSELKTKKKKPPPLPATVKQGTAESVVGVSG